MLTYLARRLAAFNDLWVSSAPEVHKPALMAHLNDWTAGVPVASAHRSAASWAQNTATGSTTTVLCEIGKALEFIQLDPSNLARIERFVERAEAAQ